jgi:hypothetical protein
MGILARFLRNRGSIWGYAILSPMDATSQKYHLLIMAIEASVLKALRLNISHKKIQESQLQAAILGSQLGIAQLENVWMEQCIH